MQNMERKLMPIHAWGLDPLLVSSRKVFVKTIHEKCKYDVDKGVFRFYYYDRAIIKVEVVGILVSKRIHTSTKGTKIYLWIDDGTGVIMCMQPIDINKPYYQTITIGCLLSVKGNLILLETNDNPYGWVIRIQSVDIFDDPNKEALYWASSLLLHQSDYVKPFQFTKQTIDALGVSYPEILQYCSCCIPPSTSSSSSSSSTSSSSSSSSFSTSSSYKKYLHIREKLLYCKCLANHCPIDPSCEFRIFFLHYLLSRENVIADNQVLELSVNDILSDTIFKQKAFNHLDHFKLIHDDEVNGLYYTQPAPSYPFLSNNTESSSSSSSTTIITTDLDDNIRTVENLIQTICKNLVSDGLLSENEGKYTLLSIERFIIPLIRKQYNKEVGDDINKRKNILQTIQEFNLNIPIYRLEYCYSKFIK